MALLRSPVSPIVLAMAACSETKPEPPAPAVVPIVASAVIDELQQARSDTARVEARSLLDAVQMHLLSAGRCPTDVAELAAAKVIAKVPVDPWGNGYALECTDGGASVVVVSLGQDGERGTGDDVLVETHEF